MSLVLKAIGKGLDAHKARTYTYRLTLPTHHLTTYFRAPKWRARGYRRYRKKERPRPVSDHSLEYGKAPLVRFRASQ